MKTTYFAAAGTAAAADTNGPGRIMGVQILTLGTAACIFYDSPTTTSTATQRIFTLVASATAGTFVPCGSLGYGIPYTTGVWVASTTNTPEMLVVVAPGVPNDNRPISA